MPLSSEELTTKRPDLLLLAAKLFLLSHTSRHSDVMELKLGLSPGESAVLATRELSMDLVDGGIILRLSAVETKPVEAVLEKTEKGLSWKVNDGKQDHFLSARLSPPEVDSWIKQNVSRAADVQFKRAEVKEESLSELGDFAGLPVQEEKR